MNKPTSSLQWIVIVLLVAFIAACVVINLLPPESPFIVLLWVIVGVLGVALSLSAAVVSVRRPPLSTIEARKTIPESGDAQDALATEIVSKRNYFMVSVSMLALSVFYLVITIIFTASADWSSDSVSFFAIQMVLYFLITIGLTIAFIAQTVSRYRQAKQKIWLRRMWLVFGIQACLMVAMIIVPMVMTAN